MGSRTWVKLYCDSWLDGTMRHEDPITRAAFIDLLALAGSGRFGDSGTVQVTKKRGFQDATLAQIIGVSTHRWRAIIDVLVRSDRISVDFQGVITIINWSKYQSEYERQRPYRSNPKLHPEVTTKVTRERERVTQREREIEIEMENERESEREKEKKKQVKKKKPYGEFQNVLLTDEEHAKLLGRFGVRLAGLIEALSIGMQSKGYRYKSHYAALLNWARRDDAKAKPNTRQIPSTTERSPTRDYGDRFVG